MKSIYISKKLRYNYHYRKSEIMKIGIANDHGGVEIKRELVKYLILQGYQVTNYGADIEEPVDYPIYAFKIGEAIKKGEIDTGILICKSGIGMSIAANKVKGVRCAKVETKEDAIITREHNHSNVIALSARTPIEEIKEIVKNFIETEYSSEERHVRRVHMMDTYDN